MAHSLHGDIQRDFPNMPYEVVRTWLIPHAARAGVGWPPGPGQAPLQHMAPPWDALLAGRPLSWWRARLWHAEPLPMVLDHMTHATRFQVGRLIGAAQDGTDFLAQSRARIAAARACIAERGTWPVPVVAFPDSDGLALVDGHHRLAALELARAGAGAQALQARHTVWLALPPPSGSEPGRLG